MPLTGEMLIGSRAVRGTGTPIQGSDPVTGTRLDPPFGTATEKDLEEACRRIQRFCGNLK